MEGEGEDDDNNRRRIGKGGEEEEKKMFVKMKSFSLPSPPLFHSHIHDHTQIFKKMQGRVMMKKRKRMKMGMGGGREEGEDGERDGEEGVGFMYLMGGELNTIML